MTGQGDTIHVHDMVYKLGPSMLEIPSPTPIHLGERKKKFITVLVGTTLFSFVVVPKMILHYTTRIKRMVAYWG